MDRWRWVNLSLFLFLSLAYVWTDRYIFFFAWISLLLLYGLSLILIWIQKRRVKVILKKGLSVYKGQAASLPLYLHNLSWLPIFHLHVHLEVRNRLTNRQRNEQVSVLLNAREKKELLLPLDSDYVGKLEVTVSEIKLFDWFRLFAVGKQIGQQVDLLILPQGFNIILGREKAFAITEQVTSHVKNRKTRDQAELLALREYVAGDQLKNIHWKLSSKFDELMVKEFDQQIATNQVLYLETSLQNDHPSIIDGMIEIIYALSLSYLKAGRAHELIWYDHELHYFRRERIQSISHVEGILKDLLSLVATIGPDIQLLKLPAVFQDISNMAIIYITSHTALPLETRGLQIPLTIQVLGEEAVREKEVQDGVIRTGPASIKEDLQRLPI